MCVCVRNGPASIKACNVLRGPSLCCYRHLFGRPSEGHSQRGPARLDSLRSADHPVMSSVYISVGRRMGERLGFGNFMFFLFFGKKTSTDWFSQ